MKRTAVAGLALTLALVAPATPVPAQASFLSPITPNPPAAVAIPSATSPGPTGTGDGVDDTAQLQSTIDALASAGGGTVDLRAGIYDISIRPGTTGTNRYALSVPSNVRLRGAAGLTTTMRLAAGQGNYYAIIRTPSNSHDVALQGFVVDGNSAGNPVAAVADVTSQPRIALITSGPRIDVRDMTFRNILGVQVVALYSSDASVVGNTFSAIGGGTVNFDHSSIYTRGDRALVQDNNLESLNGAGTFGVRTAIEIHNSDQTVTGNTIDGYLKGINATGAGAGSVSRRQLYDDNHLTNIGLGLYLWSTNSAGTADLADVEIRHNTFSINADGWLSSGMGSQTVLLGIATHPKNNQPIENLAIHHNSITFTNDSQTRNNVNYLWDSMAAGISFWSDGTVSPAPAVRNVDVHDNQINNPLSAGIWANMPITGTVEIVNNTITNPGRNNRLDKAWTSTVIPYVAEFRSGIHLGSTNQNIAVTDTGVVMTDPAIALHAGVTARAACGGTSTATGTTLTGSTAPRHDLHSCWTIT